MQGTSPRSSNLTSASSTVSRSLGVTGDPLFDPEAIEHALVGAPVAPHSNRQREVHARTELALDRAARGGPDRLDHLSAGADQDPLLGFGLDQHDRLQANQIGMMLLLDRRDLDLDRMWHLLT